jgi:dihydroflavonol-4-reductase
MTAPVGYEIAGSKVLVTGASGFVGSRLVRRLVDRGADVRILRRETSRIDRFQDLTIDHHIGDIRDGDAVRRAVSGCDLVFHVAGAISYWSGDFAWMTAVNVTGTEHVVDACLDADIGRLVHTSSVATLGVPPFSERGDEKLIYAWDGYDFGYMSTKYAAERRALEVSDELDVVVVNPALIFGPDDPGLFGPMVKLVKQGLMPVYPAGGGCFVHVDDVVEGMLLAAERGRTGERYILGGENLSWREMLTLIRIYYGCKPGVPIGHGTLRRIAYLMTAGARLLRRKPLFTPEMAEMVDMGLYFDSGKAMKELGYSYLPVADKLYETLAWYEEHGFDAQTA